MIVKVPRWESKILAHMQWAFYQPYRLGKHDCFTYLFDGVELMTGRDVVPEFRGEYKSLYEAYRMIAREGGFVDGMTARLGINPQLVAEFETGDICYFRLAGQQHIGIGFRNSITFPTREWGLFFASEFDQDRDFRVWRIPCRR